MSESPTVIDSEVVTAPPLNIQNQAEAVTENQTHPIEKVWGVARELADVALWVSRGMVESAKTCLHHVLNRYGYSSVIEALSSLSPEQRLAVESLG